MVVRKLLIPIALFVLSLLTPSSASAQASPPTFASCSSPQATLRVSYPEGQHAIVGQNALQSGSDIVYDINVDQVLQCFCSDTGNGTQTNWWKADSLTQDEIDTLVKLGWHFVPSGSIWGLDSGAYVALNSDYACAAETSPSSGTVLATAAVTTSTGGSVLGLAATGNLLTTVFYALLGVTSLIIGVFLKRINTL